MMRNAWRIAGGTGAAANTANRRVLVTNKDGTQSVQTINHELGMNARDMKDVRGRLALQGVDAADVALYGGVDTRDKPATARKPLAPGAAAAYDLDNPLGNGFRRPKAMAGPAPAAAAVLDAQVRVSGHGAAP